MSKKNARSDQAKSKNDSKDAAQEKKTLTFSHGPVASLDLERARKELEKNKIEFKIEKGELVTVDNGDANARNSAIKVVNNYKKKAS